MKLSDETLNNNCEQTEFPVRFLAIPIQHSPHGIALWRERRLPESPSVRVLYEAMSTSNTTTPNATTSKEAMTQLILSGTGGKYNVQQKR
jgi:hypothetical protein